MESSEAPYWKEVIQSEIDTIVHNNTWKLVDLPSRHKPIGHKWIFKKKLRYDGTIEKYRARLVTKGYCLKEGQDLFDTYSPVTRITFIRILIAITAIHNLIIDQMDVKIAFLNGELDEEIFMQQPEGFFVKGQEHKILIIGKNMDVINQTKKMLQSSFDMKDMGEADVILGIRIQKISNGYILTQSHYIEKTLKKFRHNDDRPVVTPFDPKVQLKKNKGQSVSQLQYTQHSMAYGLHYTKYPPVLEGFCDANWIYNHNEGKSTSGYVYTLERAVVSWKSSKQTVNTRSTIEPDFVALDKAAKEVEWLISFLEGILLWPKPVIVVCIHCDSMAALTRAKNHIYKSKSRHIRRRHNTIKDLLRNGIISIDYVKSKENIADPLTKGLCGE
ncbi:retrovirus-related pol polyprotein from transposon TNT 1-94 [Tanacetum coccineum]